MNTISKVGIKEKFNYSFYWLWLILPTFAYPPLKRLEQFWLEMDLQVVWENHFIFVKVSSLIGGNQKKSKSVKLSSLSFPTNWNSSPNENKSFQTEWRVNKEHFGGLIVPITETVNNELGKLYASELVTISNKQDKKECFLLSKKIFHHLNNLKILRTFFIILM